MKKGLLIMALLIPCLMMAQISFGVRGGVADPKGNDNMTYTFGGLFGYNVMPKLTVGVEGDYWSKGNGVSTTDIAIAAVGKYALVEAPVKVSLGAGLGLHMWKSEVTVAGITVSGSDNYFAAHGIFEVGYPVNPNLSIVAQGKYAHIFSSPSSSYVIYGTLGIVYSLAKASE
jgi:hypothetical protein